MPMSPYAFENQIIEDGLLFHEDVEAGGPSLGRGNVVPDLPFQADVGHEAMAGLRIRTGQVSRVGITVGVAVLNIEDHDEVAPTNWLLVGVGHCSSSFFEKNAWRW